MRNKMKRHIETGQIFHDNQITGKSLFDFLRVQEDITKKFLKVNVAISDDFEFYVREILSNITDDKNDMNSNSTSKFLFYHFNTLRQAQGKSFYEIRHSIITDDTVALEELQKRDWQYFIVTLLENLNKEYESDSLTDIKEKNIIEKTFENIQYLKDFYEEVFYDTSYFFHRSLQGLHDILIEKLEDDLNREIYYTGKIKEEVDHTKLFQKFSKFFFKTGRFTGKMEMAIVPRGVTPTFAKSNQLINPFDLSEKFEFTDSHGLVSVQFLAALNVFLGGDKNISKNAMSEFFHNLTMQALSKDDDRIKIRFEEITKLNKSLKKIFKIDENHSNLSFVEFQKTYEEIKEPNQLIEEEVERNILSGIKIEHPQDTGHITFLNTTDEIFADARAERELKKIYRKQ